MKGKKKQSEMKKNLKKFKYMDGAVGPKVLEL
jgi:hypothetical protein